MDEESLQTALIPTTVDLQVALQGAISLWASATTGESERRLDLLRDKQRIVVAFFRYVGKLPGEVEPSDVQGWLRQLAEKRISAGTCYQHACLLSSFYSWAMKDSEVGQRVRRNPARLARPKAPKPYQTESVKALSDEEVGALVGAVRRRWLVTSSPNEITRCCCCIWRRGCVDRKRSACAGRMCTWARRSCWHTGPRAAITGAGKCANRRFERRCSTI